LNVPSARATEGRGEARVSFPRFQRRLFSSCLVSAITEGARIDRHDRARKRRVLEMPPEDDPSDAFFAK